MTPQKIGLTALTALVLSSMIGSGIFSLPQNMAEVAGAEALIIGWMITGVGIIALGLSFWYLARLRPTLDGGIYAYARDGFGELVGFFSAWWGYWLCATIGVTGYLVVAFEALGGFTDTPEQVFFGKGNTPAAFVGESAIVWAVYWLAARGVKEAAGVNLVATLVKVFPLLLFIGLALWFFRGETFAADWHGAGLQATTLTQVKDTMLITLWVFTGVEGAAVLSAHARKRSDVGLATVLGILIALALYVAITVLALGVLPRAEIAALANPSMAGVLQAMMGSAGGIIISACLIVSVLASYLSWTLYSMEVPFYGAQYGAFPRTLAAQNENGVPHHSLRFSCITVQVCLLLVLLTGESYNALLKISTSMILVPYLLIGAYLLKIALRERLAPHIVAVGTVATLYALWILYAAGVGYLLLSVLLYVPGVALFLYAQTRFHGRFPRLQAGEIALLALLLLLLVPALQQVLADLRGAG